MKAATQPVQRPRDAKLLVVDRHGGIAHESRTSLAQVLQPGDLLVANDAATLPASLRGVHVATGREIEVRLAARPSLAVDDVHGFTAVLFGEGDYRTPTEHRPLPPTVAPGDRLHLGPLSATVLRTCSHPRLVAIRFDGTADAIWAGLARHGKPVQYAHMAQPLALWDVWTRVAAVPVAFEPPSAGFVLDWALLRELKSRGIGFATLTHAAGLSSTGDDELDARLPLPEPYFIPRATADAIRETRWNCGRVVALGTTVVRALEHAASRPGIAAATCAEAGPAPPHGAGIADQRIGPHTRLRAVDAIVSGTHEPGTSHYELLRAFAPDALLQRAAAELDAHGYLTHEFGDSVLIEAVPPPEASKCKVRRPGQGLLLASTPP
ncbi:S-adenosylmethionine:tRNA ribosyltransferase-isomerase [Ramlibacter albus]|uniref:S-adenosylmethionine:tRNA ribosyltransferase-isomerase n=1 Tax=Ramlibacter albus TaxID=2079448 RepID=A0A923M6X0_9BURK|nr:S-adenosylmethionine:tRNA ribosyltransferase-isomerase [Ramlibacter albus]MBC5763901.1 S-adenosylmethionine:tRNA ribosyltransferase-isomerase [Ramlibacter albus]